MMKGKRVNDVKVFITIDVEEDGWGEYKTTGYTVDNVTRIPLIQDLFDHYGAVPTYLVNYPVIKNEQARSILLSILDRNRCEIGAHCHPWNTPPFIEEINIHNSMLCNLPYEIQYKKIETLHEAIIDGLGLVPVCFRAGRYGFGSGVAKCIHELNYQIDTSVTPFTDWSNSSGPDFWNALYFPYRFDVSDFFLEKENGSLLEVPVTVGFMKNNFKLSGNILRWILRMDLPRLHLVGILDRMGILNHRWLSPEKSSGRDMILLAKNFMRQGYHYLNMTFHSTTLLPGKSPFVCDEKELNRFMNDIEIFLMFAQKSGMEFIPLSSALEIFHGRKCNDN